MSLIFGTEFGRGPFKGFPDYDNRITQAYAQFYNSIYLDPFGTQVDQLFFDGIYDLSPSLYDNYLNVVSFAPWPAPHTTLFAAPGSFVGINNDGFYPFIYYDGIDYPGEYLGIAFDIPATEILARFATDNNFVDNLNRFRYYYHRALNYVTDWPYEQEAYYRYSEVETEFILPFHVTAKTVDGYFYYDWLIPSLTRENYFDVSEDFNGIPYIFSITAEFTLLASDPRGIDWLKVYSLIPENNREGIYFNYGWENFLLPYYYHWLYLEGLVAKIATPSSTRTISATVSPTPNFLRQPSHSATRSPSVTHTAGTRTPTSSHTPIYKSQSNTPTRTPNLSPSRSPTPSQSFVPAASAPASASALGQSATSTKSVSPSATKSPVSATTSPTVTNTATGTRTAFLTASNTQAPGRNVPSASIAPSSSPAAPTFAQPASSTAVLVQFNVLCAGYCSGESALQLQLEIARALNLDTEFIRIVAIHEFFEGDSEITVLICSNDGVDDLLNSIQAGSFTQEYFITLSVESVDWTVRCDMDLYNYLALSSQYIDTASSASSLLPLFVLFFLQLWMLA